MTKPSGLFLLCLLAAFFLGLGIAGLCAIPGMGMMAYGDIAPGAHRVWPGADPQLALLHRMARDAYGVKFSTRELAMSCDLTPDRCRVALKALLSAGLVTKHSATRGCFPLAGFPKVLWEISSKGRVVVGVI